MVSGRSRCSPFVIMALAGIASPAFAAAHLGGEAAFIGYGAVILSFMGGVRWGAALQPSSGSGAERMIMSVAPSLAAWLALSIDRPGRCSCFSPGSRCRGSGMW
ncbi:DUF3429 domain-containing protein [uncultured Hoeflea sp.]|uniref:DUF3429 domain-containing protein n=1 Tax=uncultured Hoeflea sp. TaxID=538666 RepID=UPI0030EB861E